MRWLNDNFINGGGQANPQTAQMLNQQQLKEAMALTAGMMTCVDDAVGEIVKALERNGQLENTVICYTSDHGDYLGDFNLMLKGALPFRSITRVPFIWSDPNNRTEASSDALASTVDLAATILDRVGIEPFNGNQGQSFKPAIDGSTGVRNELLIEYNDGGVRLGFEKPARVRALVTPQWRYTMYLNEDWGELYDLINDPNETHNLWELPEHFAQRAYLAERLTHHLTAQMDESPAADRIA
jgi:arylsulfatase A-like enzyme